MVTAVGAVVKTSFGKFKVMLWSTAFCSWFSVGLLFYK